MKSLIQKNELNVLSLLSKKIIWLKHFDELLLNVIVWKVYDSLTKIKVMHIDCIMRN